MRRWMRCGVRWMRCTVRSKWWRIKIEKDKERINTKNAEAQRRVKKKAPESSDCYETRAKERLKRCSEFRSVAFLFFLASSHDCCVTTVGNGFGCPVVL